MHGRVCGVSGSPWRQERKRAGRPRGGHSWRPAFIRLELDFGNMVWSRSTRRVGGPDCKWQIGREFSFTVAQGISLFFLLSLWMPCGSTKSLPSPPSSETSPSPPFSACTRRRHVFHPLPPLHPPNTWHPSCPNSVGATTTHSPTATPHPPPPATHTSMKLPLSLCAASLLLSGMGALAQEQATTTQVRIWNTGAHSSAIFVASHTPPQYSRALAHTHTHVHTHRHTPPPPARQQGDGPAAPRPPWGLGRGACLSRRHGREGRAVCGGAAGGQGPPFPQQQGLPRPGGWARQPRRDRRPPQGHHGGGARQARCCGWPGQPGRAPRRRQGPCGGGARQARCGGGAGQPGRAPRRRQGRRGGGGGGGGQAGGNCGPGGRRARVP